MAKYNPIDRINLFIRLAIRGKAEQTEHEITMSLIRDIREEVWGWLEEKDKEEVARSICPAFRLFKI